MQLDYTGLIQIFAGTYMLLIAFKVIPVNANNPEWSELWLKKFGGFMKLCGPIVIGIGVMELIGAI